MIDAYFTLFVTTHGDTCLFMHVLVHVYVCVCSCFFQDYYEHTFSNVSRRRSSNSRNNNGIAADADGAVNEPQSSMSGNLCWCIGSRVVLVVYLLLRCNTSSRWQLAARRLLADSATCQQQQQQLTSTPTASLPVVRTKLVPPPHAALYIWQP